MKLTKICKLTFEIEFVEGGRISGGGGSLEIGAVIESNLTVMRNPQNGEPYVPGSSIKGKIRCTAERIAGLIGENGEPHGQRCGKSDCLICRVFGPHKNTRSESGPTRISVRDAQFTEAYRREYERRIEESLPVFEEKSENTIDRNRGTAGNPRTMERLLPGATFQAEIVLRIYEGDPEDEFVDLVSQALRVVEEGDSLGAGGSRGSGRIRISSPKRTCKNVTDMKLVFSDN